MQHASAWQSLPSTWMFRALLAIGQLLIIASASYHTGYPSTRHLNAQYDVNPWPPSVHNAPAGRSESEQRAAAAACARFDETYRQIDRDLALWADKGISQADMKRTIRYNTTKGRAKGIALGFEAGRAYLVDEPRDLPLLGHHRMLFRLYMRTMLDLERRFGLAMPDVEFVIQTMDRPIDLISHMNGTYNPIMRFCKSDAHSDILIPGFHFHSKRFDSVFLASMPNHTANHPWATRTPKAFSRNSLYSRYLHTDDRSLWREGYQGKSICQVRGSTAMCPVREHFQQWARHHPDLLDVSNRGHRKIEDFATFKYLVQLDGQGLSSKMEQLLTLGSLVLREESGYYGYFYSMLKPYKHFIPFWKKRPEEILDVLGWAAEHDAEAEAIGRAGQEFARTYLNAEARSCYWLTLLTRFAKLLQYTPGRANRQYKYYVPVESYLQNTQRKLELGQELVFEP